MVTPWVFINQCSRCRPHTRNFCTIIAVGALEMSVNYRGLRVKALGTCAKSTMEDSGNIRANSVAFQSSTKCGCGDMFYLF